MAQLRQEDKVLSETPLYYAGEQSTFTGKLKLLNEGLTEIVVLGTDPANANFGMVSQYLTVKPKE